MKVSVVIPNFNGKNIVGNAIDSLLLQSIPVEIIVVENGSSDGSEGFLRRKYADSITLLINKTNLGFDGGVNTGIVYSLEKNYEFTALLNSDAVADKDWIRNLLLKLEDDGNVGIVTSKILDLKGKRIDSVGDYYTIWGLAYPSGRGELDNGQYDTSRYVFGASGGASLYRNSMFRQIGLFDEDFFAYYEDIDISFRAQIAGWKVWYESSAKVNHATNTTAKKMSSDFMTYHTLKNLPWVLVKNVPLRFFIKILPRFMLAFSALIFSALSRMQFIAVLKGLMIAAIKTPKKLMQRVIIQKSRNVSYKYLSEIIVKDLPPNAHKLKRIRNLLGVKH